MFLSDAERLKMNSDNIFQQRVEYMPPPPTPPNNNIFNGLLNTVVGGIGGLISGGPIGALAGAGTGLAKSVMAGNSDPKGNVPIDLIGSATEGFGGGMIPEALTKSAETSKALGIAPKLDVGGYDAKDLLTVAKGVQTGNMLGTVAAIDENTKGRKKEYLENKKLASDLVKGDLELMKAAQDVSDQTGIARKITLSDSSVIELKPSEKSILANKKSLVDIQKAKAEIEKLQRDNPNNENVKYLTPNAYLDYVQKVGKDFDLKGSDAFNMASTLLTKNAPSLIPPSVLNKQPQKKAVLINDVLKLPNGKKYPTYFKDGERVIKYNGNLVAVGPLLK